MIKKRKKVGIMHLIEINCPENSMLDEELEIDSAEVGAKVFRNIIEQQKVIGKSGYKKQKTADLCKELYDSMSEKNRHIVNSAILDFIPEEIQRQNFGEYFTVMMNNTSSFSGEPLTLYKIAQLIYAKNICLQTRGEVGTDMDYFYEDVEVLRAKLKSFQGKEKSTDKSNNLETDVSTIFSCESELLSEGIGIKYDINWEFVESQLEEQNIDVSIFFKNAVNEYVKCNSCEFKNGKNKCKQQDMYIEFLMYDKYSYAELLAKLLGVKFLNVLKRTEVTFFDDEFPFEKYYRKLSKEIQLHINNLIRNVYLIENLAE